MTARALAESVPARTERHAMIVTSLAESPSTGGSLR